MPLPDIKSQIRILYRIYTAEKEAKDKRLFGSYSSAANYAIEHREEYESFDEALDAWDDFKRRKK